MCKTFILTLCLLSVFNGPLFATPKNPADWKSAVWIDDGKQNPTADADFYKDDAAPLFRREFKIEKPIAKATLHFVGLGLGLPSINGKPLADHVFDPPWTNFEKRILFRSHDVTAQLKEGENCLGIELGNGWYNPLPLRMWGQRNIRGSLPVGRPRAIAYLSIEHPDGTATEIVTDKSWQTTTGPTLRNSIYLGEKRDARLAIPGWSSPGNVSGKWIAARETTDPLAPLQPLAMAPVRSYADLSAVSVERSGDKHIVDFGINFTGLAKVNLNVPAGTEIVLRYGELLRPDGSLNGMTSVAGQIKGMIKNEAGELIPKGGPGAPEIAWQSDSYIAKGGGESFQPKFTFRAFRYLEISGLTETPSPEDFSAIALSSELPSRGTFSCSNKSLNRIQQIVRNTFNSNMMTVQSDCPHRERFAYGGDIVATSEAYLMNFDMSGFYAKTVHDWADAVRPDGRLTDTAPFVGIDYCGIGWAMVHPLLLEQLYQHYGNIELVREQLPVAIKWLEVVAAKRENGLVMKGLTDHESINKETGPKLRTTMFIASAKRLARLAKIVENEAAAQRFTKLANESTTAWEEKFLNPETGKIGSQSAQVFALGFGGATATTTDKIFAELVRNLTKPEDSPRLSTGIFGTAMLMEQLSKNGRSDLAYALADREEFPSWKHMLNDGATTLPETWKKNENAYSQNHPMFGSISAWFFRWLGGIQPAPDAVGFDKIIICPQIVADLDWVKTTHQTIHGEIVSNWKKTDSGTQLEVTIPANSSAVIQLPSTGKAIAEGLTFEQKNGLQTATLAPGTYLIQLTAD